MSQAKVDRYKEQKANRKEIMKKEKQKKMIYKSVAAVICVCIVGWLGFSTYVWYDGTLPTESVEVNYTSVEEYVSNLYY